MTTHADDSLGILPGEHGDCPHGVCRCECDEGCRAEGVNQQPPPRHDAVFTAQRERDWVAVDIDMATVLRMREIVNDWLNMGCDDETERPAFEQFIRDVDGALERTHDYSDSTGHCSRCGLPIDEDNADETNPDHWCPGGTLL